MSERKIMLNRWTGFILAALLALASPQPASAAFVDQQTWGGTAGGSANALTLSIGNWTKPVPGVPLRFIVLLKNTGPVTLAINGQTPVAVYRQGAAASYALSGGELVAGQVAIVIYDGSQFELPGNSRKFFTASATDFGARCDGSTDDTAAINLAETSLSVAGGILNFPSGTCITTGLTKLSGVIWQGAGIGETIIKLKAGTVANAVVAGQNAYSLFGSGSHNGITNFSIFDLTVDGNVGSGGSSDCLGIYAYAYTLERLELQNCSGYGLRTGYAVTFDGQEPSHSDNASSWLNDSLIHDNNLGGVWWQGPQDSSITGNYIYRNLVVGLWATDAATGLKLVNDHAWGSLIFSKQAITGFRLDTGFNMIVNSTAEGATGQQVWLKNVNNVIVGGRYYYESAVPNSVYCFRLGDTANSLVSGANTIITAVNDCDGAGVFFDDDGGSDSIQIDGFNQSGGNGYTGTPGSSSTINIQVHTTGSAVTNPSLVVIPGPIKFAGSFTPNGSVAVSLGSTGPAGAHATPQEWFVVIDTSGVTRYIPAF